MNFKTKSNNITKVLYTVLVLCIISIMILSIYSMFNKPEVQNNQGNSNGGNSLKNDIGYENSEDAAFEFFKKSTTEASTKAVTQNPADAPPKQNEIQKENEPIDIPDMTDKEADIIIDPPEDVIEVAFVPSVYIKPVAGYVSTRHNPDTPEYSVAMNDYRTHMGIDIDSEVGINVKAVSDGIISKIYDDPLMGMTVVIDHPENVQSVYMNLQPNLPKNITVGTAVKGGEIIGGIGESALVEIYDVPHLHFEMKKDGNNIDPFEYIEY